MSYEDYGEAGPSNQAEIPYDPDQDPEERRDLRKKYRDLRAEIEERQNQDGAAEFMLQTVKVADKLFQNVKGTGEATLDSDLLVKASVQSAMMARAMKSGSGAFDIDDYITKLVIFMGGRHDVAEVDEDDDVSYSDEGDGAPLDWERIGWKAMAKSHRVPVMDFMLGPLSVEQKKRNVGKRAKLEKHKEDQRKPQEITEDDITRSENETTKNVAALERILEGTGEINLFRFIINPNDFAQSVENLFYTSFLIRDGKCALQIENGEPTIFICEPPTADDYSEGLKKHQLVMELDMATWRRSIEVFDIKTSTIPPRPKAETRIGDKWYG
ncbi:Non-structural maintenance of chromosome element 4 [Phanerochaete sordida]|uniref:Non-structural maintenance of chromosomes element 4 n=1 Tax=Phanerochaete sordida TaxID=48140 RepID=A0A9P3GFS4_9APHY|nr:Non-structural maintenance of chromosome element 4 [Phanerochaete sordida]